jgi:hypothetical protein
MICHDCMLAATYNSNEKYALAGTFHDKCEGDCGCQHKTGPGWFVRRGEKPKPMQTQSP